MINWFRKEKKFLDCSVLVVEDSDVDRKIIVRALEKLTCRVLTAGDGQEGYEMALANKPDIILSDCSMPRMDGVEMCKMIKKSEEIKDIPIIFLTGLDSPKVVIDCFELDAENFMCKPINPRLLTSQVEQIIKEHFLDRRNS